ncbi:hypothetical protein BHE74_00002647 [Ensete ventricosum]|nr:hypothetical protein GW17_00004989 [Ensete ventricosum]RWW88468.1 hypothetical protein BHE74_00002647 [Ensete ventricosum]RZS26342.1 hypothetical protein BHM03_00059664 [Ensete ventricosum]
MTLGTSMAARQGPLAMAAHQICLQVWLAVSLLSDALAVSAQVCCSVNSLALIASSSAKCDYDRVKQITYYVLKMVVGAMSSAFLLYAPSVYGLAGVWFGLTLFMGLRMMAGFFR